MNIQIIAEEETITIVLPRKLEMLVIPWQEAANLGETLGEAARGYKCVVDMARVGEELRRLKISSDGKNCVALMLDHNDRICLCPEAAKLLGTALRKQAQDVEYLRRGVNLDALLRRTAR